MNPTLTTTSIRAAALSLALSVAAPAQQANHGLALNGVDAFGTAAGVGGLVSNSTWEAWVKLPTTTNTTGYRPVLFRWGMYSHGLNVNASTGQTNVSMYSCGGSCSNPESAAGSLAPNHWHHVAMVYGPQAGPDCTVYLDGQVVAECEAQGCAPYAGWETVLGAVGYIGYSGFLDATVDEARISNIPRYAASFVPQRRFESDANTVGLWHFDEGAGSVAFDSSPAGRHFTLQGGYAWVAGNSSGNATFTAFGAGCTGPSGTPLLAPKNDSQPRLGTTFQMQFAGLPNGYVFVPLGFLGFDNMNALGVPLPVSLSHYGGPPQCLQHIDLTDAYYYPLANLGGSTEWHVPLPNTPFLDGASVFVQGIVFDWSLPYSLPVLSSNGGEMRMHF
jgi:hypothetical protein